MSPDRSLRGFFSSVQYGDEKTEGWRGASGKGGRCSIFRTEKYFYYHRASNDRSVLSVSLTILCSVAGINHSRGEVLPYKRLMGMRHWMRSHFHVWIDYNGFAFSMELLEWGRTFSDFLGKKSSSHLRLANVSES